MSNLAEPVSVSTTSENSVETTTNTNKPKNNTPKNNTNYSNSMKGMFGDDENAFANNSAKNNASKNNASKNNNNYSDSMQEMFKEEESVVEDEPVNGLNSKIEAMQPLLEKVVELKASYKNTPNQKRNAIKEEFENTKERLVTLQTEINELIADMTIETNAISFLKEKYPNYVSSLERLNVLEKNSQGEEEMGASQSNNNNAMNINNNNVNRNANTVANNQNQNQGNANPEVNLNSNGKNSRVNSLNNNNTKKKPNNTKPVNDPTPKPPSNNNTRRNLSGGKRRKNKSRKGNTRR